MRALPLLLLATSALAQTTTPVTFGIRETPDSTTDQLVIGASACGTERLVYWVWNQIGTIPCNNLRVWATDGSCGNEPGAKDVEYASVSPILLTSARRGQFTVVIDELPGFVAGTTTPCGGAATLTKEHRICAAVPTAVQCGFQTTTVTTASPLRIIYDAQPPNAPVVTGVSSLDKALRVGFSVSSDTIEVVPFSRPQGQADFRRHKTVSLGTSREIKIDELLNGTTYDIQLRAIDGAGNESADSELASGTPIRTIGFWGVYRDSGGTDTGGCSAAPHLFSLLAIAALARRRIR